MEKYNDHLFVIILILTVGIFVFILFFIWMAVHSYHKLTRHKRAFRQTELSHERDLSMAIFQSEEKERVRIGMDLHDEIGSPLSLLKLLVGEIQHDQTQAYLDRCKTLIDHTIFNIRKISHHLSPFLNEIYRLDDVLEDLADSVNLTNLVQMEVTMPDSSEWLDHLDQHRAMVLFRIINELVNNSLKHSQATILQLDLQLAIQKLRLNYRDNGVGFDPDQLAKGGTGLKNIKSRLNLIAATYSHQHQNPGFNLMIELNLI